MTPSLIGGSFAKFHAFDFKHGGAVVRDGQTLVCARLSPPPALALSLSLHRHPYLCIPLSSRFIRYNKPLKNLKPACGFHAPLYYLRGIVRRPELDPPRLRPHNPRTTLTPPASNSPKSREDEPP
jgi:hypothetical protein